MRFRVRLAIFCYLVLVATMGLELLLLALNAFALNGITHWLTFVYEDLQSRWILGGIGTLILILNYLFLRTIVGDQARGKTIAFDNPGGRVTVSLNAMEDLIRRLVSREPDVKEVRATINARKKRLEADVRVVLNSDINIPDLTQRLQEMIRGKIQDTIGLEETVVIRMHVVKIVSDYKGKSDKNKDDKYSRGEETLPFQGYRL